MLADDSHEIFPNFFQKLEKMSLNLSSAAVVIGALRVKSVFSFKNKFTKCIWSNTQRLC